MALVRIRINGREYDLACDDGQEDHLRLLADEVDARVRSLGMGTLNNPGEVMCLLLASLTMADDVLEARKLATPAPQESAAERNRRTQEEERQRAEQERYITEMELAMATTLDDIASRIEKIAEQIEIR